MSKNFETVFKVAGKIDSSFTEAIKETSEKFKSLNRISGSLASGFKKIAGAAVGVAAVGAGAVVALDAITKSDAQMQSLAKSVGMSVDKLAALESVVASAGFNYENIVDLQEELNNKIGESKGIEEITAVTESLEILGLAFEDIEKLKPDQQFEAVANAALKMADAQEAASALDMLMGGEASKMIGLMRERGASIEEITAEYYKLNVRTEESRKGALAFNRSMQTMKTFIGGVTSELAGLVGSSLAPLIDKMAGWIEANKDVVQSGIADFATKTANAIAWLVENMDQVSSTAKAVGTGLLVFGSVIVVLNTFITVMTAVNIVMAMNPAVGIVIGVMALIAAITVLVMNFDKVKSAASSAFKAIKDNGLKWLSSLGEFILNWSPLGLFYKAFAGVISYFGVDMPSKFTEFGASIIKGLASGITSAASAVIDKAKEIASKITSAVKSVFDINSPSRVFMQIGKYNMEGLSDGMDNNAGGPKRSAIDAAKGAIPALNVAKGSSTGANQSTAPVIELNLTQHISAGTYEEARQGASAGAQNLIQAFEDAMARKERLSFG